MSEPPGQSLMNPKIREALTRALPYISPGRREVLVAVLLGEKFNQRAWLDAKCFVASFDLEWFIYRLTNNVQNDDTFFINRINAQIDAFESLGE